MLRHVGCQSSVSLADLRQLILPRDRLAIGDPTPMKFGQPKSGLAHIAAEFLQCLRRALPQRQPEKLSECLLFTDRTLHEHSELREESQRLGDGDRTARGKG